MKHRNRVLSCVSAIALLSTPALSAPPAALAITSSSTLAAAQQAPQAQPQLPQDPALTTGTLANGMKYIIRKNATPSGTVALRMAIDAGSTYEQDDQRGLAHFLEHMAFNGSKNVPEGEMVKLLERYGLAFGADTNASTGFDQTQYQLDLPSTSEEVIDTGFFLMREIAGNLTFNPDAVDRERGIIKSEERLRNTAGLRGLVSLLEFAVPDTILKDRLPIGDLNVIATAPRERFVDYYEKYYTPQRATMIVVGDIDPEAMKTKIEAVFSDWKPSPKAIPGGDPDLGVVKPLSTVKYGAYFDPDIATSVQIVAAVPPANIPDGPQGRQLTLVRNLANGIVNRRLAKVANDPDAPFVNGGVAFQELFKAADLVQINLTTTPEKWQAALKAGEQELRRALQFGFTQTELEEQIATQRAQLENLVKRADTQDSSRLARAYVAQVNLDRALTHPQVDLDIFNAIAGQLTPQLLQQVFAAQWARTAPAVRLVTKEPFDNAEAEIQRVYETSATVAVAAPENKARLAFAYTDFGEAGQVVSDTNIEGADIRTIRFANNVRLNIKNTAFEKGVVNVSLRVGGGLLEFPKDVAGLGLLAGTFNIGGLEKHSFTDLQSLTAGKTVQLNFAAGEDFFGGNARTTADDLEFQLQLLAAYVTSPGFRPEGEARAHQIAEVFLPTLLATPGGVAQLKLGEIVHNGDKRFGIGTTDEIKSLTYETLKGYMARALREGAIEIGIVGDVDEDAAIAAVAKTFGAIAGRNADVADFADGRNVVFAQDRSDVTLKHTGPANKSQAIVYWPTTDNDDAKEAAELRLLQGLLRIKLTEELREALGATYSPQVQSTVSRTFDDYGFVAAISEVEPQDLDRVITAIDAIAEKIGKPGGISDDELLRVKQPILEQLEEARENNQALLQLVATAQTDPERIKRFEESASVYQSVSVGDLTNIARKYLQADQALRVRIISDKAE